MLNRTSKRHKKKQTKRNRTKHNKIKRNRSKHNRKTRGGMRYGTGIGANCYDPNQSIYNTNMLKLFPYKA